MLVAKILEPQGTESPLASDRLAQKKEKEKRRTQKKVGPSDRVLRPNKRPQVVGSARPKRPQKGGKGNKSQRGKKQKQPTLRARLGPKMKIRELLNPAPQESTVPRCQAGIRQNSMEHCIEVSQPKEQEIISAPTEGILSSPRQAPEVNASAAVKRGRGKPRGVYGTRCLPGEPSKRTRTPPRRSGLRPRGSVSKQPISRGSSHNPERHLDASSAGVMSSWIAPSESESGAMLEELGARAQRHLSMDYEAPQSEIALPSNARAASAPASVSLELVPRHRSLDYEAPQSETTLPSNARATSAPAFLSLEEVHRQLESAQPQELAISESTCYDMVRFNPASEEEDDHTRNVWNAQSPSSDASSLSDPRSDVEYDDDVDACLRKGHVTTIAGTEDIIVMPKTPTKLDQEVQQKGQKRKRGEGHTGPGEELRSLLADKYSNILEGASNLKMRCTRARYRSARDQRPPVNDEETHPTVPICSAMDPTTIHSTLPLSPSSSPTLSSSTATCTDTTAASQGASMFTSARIPLPPLASVEAPVSLEGSSITENSPLLADDRPPLAENTSPPLAEHTSSVIKDARGL
ncbi:MAG: hypothetical protein M1816_006602 [Peltula sp. TS41687]|nr:MAG: hypothetical protein M1816_006602 [Peltula sp. TS41687]